MDHTCNCIGNYGDNNGRSITKSRPGTLETWGLGSILDSTPSLTKLSSTDPISTPSKAASSITATAAVSSLHDHRLFNFVCHTQTGRPIYGACLRRPEDGASRSQSDSVSPAQERPVNSLSPDDSVFTQNSAIVDRPPAETPLSPKSPTTFHPSVDDLSTPIVASLANKPPQIDTSDSIADAEWIEIELGLDNLPTSLVSTRNLLRSLGRSRAGGKEGSSSDNICMVVSVRHDADDVDKQVVFRIPD